MKRMGRLREGVQRVAAVVMTALMLLSCAAAENAALPAPGVREIEAVRNVVFLLPAPGEEYTDQNQWEQKGASSQQNVQSWQNEDGSRRAVFRVTSYRKDFSLDPEVARAMYHKWTEGIAAEELLWKREILLNGGRPACMLATSGIAAAEDGGEIRDTVVSLLYFYCCNMLEMHYEFRSPSEESFSPPAIDEFQSRFSTVSYSVPEDRDGLPEWLVTPDCFVTKLTAKDDAIAVAAGKTLQITAHLQGEKQVRAMNASLMKQTWLVLDAQKTVREGKWVLMDASVASVSQSGTLRAGSVEHPVLAEVVAYNQAIDFTASLTVLLLPRQKSFTLSEKQATLRVGQAEPLRVSVIAEPEETLLYLKDYSNVKWMMTREGDVASLRVMEDGTAEVSPLQVGFATLTAKDIISGRSAQITIRVQNPAE